MAIEINDQIIKDAVSSAICSIYNLQEINYELTTNDATLYANNEELKNIVCILRSIKVDLINALHQYDE